MARFLISAFCLLLLFGYGCGTKQKPVAPEPELTVGEQAAMQRVALWHTLIEEGQVAPIDEKLAMVNRFFNRLEFVDDLSHWGKEDYWATPTEMLVSNGGDCEDFAIAKYLTLIQMQVPVERLRLTYVKSLKLNKPHMVLSYYATATGEPLLLDSLTAQVVLASQRPDLLPVYSFNGEGLWQAKQRGDEKPVGSAARLSLWQEVLQRFQNEAKAATSSPPGRGTR
ncbi:MAG: transglutaminase-like cysteine peptidase [Desulfobulbaceae bacterium]|nr:transglutaminase-like cysteine peptidase [Desulfobulbaceae bacterium]